MEQKIPKFRKVSGLMKWVYSHNVTKRLPRDREEVFFASNENALAKASHLSRYGMIVGKLDYDLERLLLGDLGGIVDYGTRIHRDGYVLDDDLLSALKGNGRHLVRLARNTKRLPEWLEDTIEEPGFLLDYAKTAIRGRLPHHLELRLVGDVDRALKYAFDVIRGFSSVRLPDELHTFLAMKAFENTEHQGIKNYFAEIRKEPETSVAG
jgi:hypothetical protein